MKKKKLKQRITLTVAILLNMIAVYVIVMTVITSINQFNRSSFTQNVENIKTLTNSSASKVKLLISHYTTDAVNVGKYINQYKMVGMTEEEMQVFFQDYYSDKDIEWQVINNKSSGAMGTSSEVFNGVLLGDEEGTKISYNVNSYQPLAKVFCLASEETLGTIDYINEFTDVYSLKKAFAISCVIRIRKPALDAKQDSYEYKTLMLVIESARVNQLIESNTDLDNLDYYDYANAIIDMDGNYVLSNMNFQGTNIFHYLETYNTSLSKERKDELREGLLNAQAVSPFYYNNNKGMECIYTVSKIEDTDWYILSTVPIESFHNVDNYANNYIRFFLAFIALFLLDLCIVIIIIIKLRHKSKEAQAANIAKSKFLSAMSHDIRTPMNAIIGMTIIADNNLKQKKPNQDILVDCIKTIELSGNHLLTLINDILDISKIESGKLAIVPNDFSISETVCKMIDIVQAEINEKGFDFTSSIRNVKHEFVYADGLRINQIFINILSNAIKYTNPGGTIKVELYEEEIPKKENYFRYVYRVSDTGIGMDDEFQKTIFDRFSRAVDTRINTIQGSGLGMAITKQLVDLIGGTISLQSKLNVGSVFTVCLELPMAKETIEEINLPPLSILVMDEDIETATLIKETLEQNNMTVTTATCEIELEKFELANSDCPPENRDLPPENSYDVIFIDRKIAQNNIKELINHLKSVYGDTVKIIVMTTNTVLVEEREEIIDGITFLLKKPLYQSKLLHTLETLFAESTETSRYETGQQYNLKVLVAEDNEINWKVMNRILQSLGVSAERAENGYKAVEKIRESKSNYDLVFMDIQMPVMNGYDATQAIRQLEDSKKATIPIYAMTADAFAEDIANCMERGMNGHLSKPIEMERLQAVLKNFARN